MDGMTAHSRFVVLRCKPPKTPFSAQHWTHWEVPGMSKTEHLTLLPKLCPLKLSPSQWQHHPGDYAGLKHQCHPSSLTLSNPNPIHQQVLLAQMTTSHYLYHFLLIQTTIISSSFGQIIVGLSKLPQLLTLNLHFNLNRMILLKYQSNHVTHLLKTLHGLLITFRVKDKVTSERPARLYIILTPFPLRHHL